MAKWGEGDPRWIVEERADATNVNNWHWTEKNASVWSKEKLKALLEGLEVEDDTYKAKLVELSKTEGEASASNRKAKLIFFFEWELHGTWEGTVEGNSRTFKGKYDIPNLSDENQPSDVDITFTTESKDDDAYKLKEFLRKEGTAKVRDAMAKYISSLKEEYSQGMILPTSKSQPELKSPPPTTENTVKKEMNKLITKQDSTNSEIGVRIPCKRLTGKEEFMCPPTELYRALTEKDMVRAFTRGDAEVEAEKGGRFKMFDGNIYGEFIDLELNTKIAMRWRFKTWPCEHYSTVTIDLTDKGDCTELVLTQSGVPQNDFDRTREGWKRYYWEAIKQTFGFGARLF